MVPVGWRFDGEQDTIDFGGHGLAQSQRYRDVPTDWARRDRDRRPGKCEPPGGRAVEERDTTEVLADQKPLIRIHAERSSHGNSKLAFA